MALAIFITAMTINILLVIDSIRIINNHDKERRSMNTKNKLLTYYTTMYNKGRMVASTYQGLVNSLER